MKGHIVLAILVLASERSAAVAAPSKKPALRIDATTRQPRQGDVIALTVRSDRPLTSLVLVDDERRIAMERGKGGTVFRGLLGFDFEGPAGPRTLELVASEGAEPSRTTPYAIRVGKGRFLVQKLAVDPRFVEVPEAESERVKGEQRRVLEVWKSADAARRFAGSFRLPADARLEENFGAKRVYNGESRSRHAGLDLAAPEGAPVLASAAARVALTGELYFSGGTVILDHGGGLFTMYFHLSSVDVKEGELVAQGQRLGAVGHTGRATGPHLHWAAKLNGARVNPESLLKLPPWSPPAP
jgi:murein DD-endopeptidase MepM/ murein hydrolase activator NlpD